MYLPWAKPLIDAFFSILLILFLAPVLILLSVLIYIKMGRPIFFKQRRPGKNEVIFSIYKFRTMQEMYDEAGSPLSDAQRLKGLGKILRSLSLDELPQLFNVLKGDMSFIGPRPLLIEYLSLYSPAQKHRHDIKPGITGWAQVNGRNSISWKEKFDFDLEYLNKMSFLLDLKILFLTLQRVFKKSGISSNTHTTMEKFNGSN